MKKDTPMATATANEEKISGSYWHEAPKDPPAGEVAPMPTISDYPEATVAEKVGHILKAFQGVRNAIDSTVTDEAWKAKILRKLDGAEATATRAATMRKEAIRDAKTL